MNNIKQQFPIFTNNPKLVYLDNGASTQTLQVVIDAMNEYYTTYRSNVHRGLYDISERATEEYENARKLIAGFINAEPNEIAFTSGATHGLNALAFTLASSLKPGDNVVLTRMEHHANLVPWQQMAFKHGFEIRFINLTNDYQIDLESAKRVITPNTKILSFAHISNVLGAIAPAKELIDLGNAVGAITIIDAAQSIAHLPIDVKQLNCDFLVFSGHKMYGPTGIGAIYGKKENLETLNPFLFGGEMVSDVTYENAGWNEIPARFEAGTQNIAGAIGLGAAIKFLTQIGWSNILKHENELIAYALEKLKPLVKIVGPTSSNDPSPYPLPRGEGKDLLPPTGEGRDEGQSLNRSGVFSFTVPNAHPHDVGEIVNREGVAIRVGHHCAMPLHKHLGLVGTARASVGIYNTKEDIDALIKGIEKIKEIF